ncbi:MAG: ABC transporter substrate-binding protein [Trebonia sp.]
MKVFTRFAVVGLACLLASACSSSGRTANSGSGLVHVVVGQLPIADTAAVEIAMKEGFFKQQGLDVTTVAIQQSTAAIPLMLHGSVDITSGNYTSFIDADATGVTHIEIVAAGDSCSPSALVVLARPKSKISGAATLAGKTIAVNIDPDIQTLTINALLKASGVNPGSVKYVTIPFPDMGTALAAGRVDAIAETEPFITAAEKDYDAVNVLTECAGPTADMPLGAFAATSQWVTRNPKAALGFQRAIQEASAVADSHRKLVQQLLPAYTSITPKVAAVISLPDYATTLTAPQVQRVADLMLTGGMLKKKFDVAPILFHPAGRAPGNSGI